MEYSLTNRVNVTVHAVNRLNPCSNGILSDTWNGSMDIDTAIRLNPCSNGILSDIISISDKEEFERTS